MDIEVSQCFFLDRGCEAVIGGFSCDVNGL